MTDRLNQQRATSNQKLEILAALLLLGLFAWMTAPGFGGTSDSAHYLATARHLRQGAGLVDVDGLPYRYWGPLFPVLLAVLQSPLALRLLHGAALLGHLLLWSRLGRGLLPAARARWLPLLLALSTAVLVPTKFVWAETVFELLAASYFGALMRWLHTNRGGWLMLATSAGFLLPLQRTSGVFLLGGAAVGLLVTGIVRGRWRGLSAHGLACASGFLAWNYYAEVLAGPPVYQALGDGPKLVATLADYGFVLWRWLLPLATSWRVATPTLWALALPVFLLLLWPRYAALNVHQPTGQPATQPAAAATQRLLWWVLLINIIAHVAATNLARGAAGLHDTERYLTAVAAPVILLVLAAWPARLNHRSTSSIVLALWLLYSAVRVAHNAHKLRSTPVVEWAFGPGDQSVSPTPATAAPAANPGTAPAARPS